MKELLQFKSTHFSMHQLAEGVYAAIHKEGGSAISNAGLIDLGGQLLVFDTFLTPQAASDLRQFALDTYNHAPHFIINSHYHNDHIWGNQVFAKEAKIISSAKTYRLIDTLGKEEYQWYAANAEQRLIEIQTHLQDENLEKSLIGMLGYYSGLVEALPSLEISKPTITFESQLNLYGANRCAELITFQGAHTGSDTILYLPQDRILFMSDLLFVKSQPYLVEGNPELLMDILNDLIQVDAEVYIPGHGPIGGKEDLSKMMAYVDDCIDVVNGFIESGADRGEITGIKVPQKYQSWDSPQFFQANLEFIFERKMSSDRVDGDQ
jgi:cyclase